MAEFVMTQMTQQNDAERLWSRWQELCDIRSEMRRRVAVRRAEHDTARAVSFEAGERAWDEYRLAVRDYDIAHARVEVIYARYIAAEYHLCESAVFDVD